jgi:hypothetical protein
MGGWAWALMGGHCRSLGRIEELGPGSGYKPEQIVSRSTGECRSTQYERQNIGPDYSTIFNVLNSMVCGNTLHTSESADYQ